jgi:hypothetical protein
VRKTLSKVEKMRKFGGFYRAQFWILLLTDVPRVMTVADYERRGELGWERRCVGVETMVSLYQTTYSALPVPQAGRVRLASVALRRASLASELAAAGTRQVLCDFFASSESQCATLFLFLQ